MQERISQAKTKMETTLVEGSAGAGLVKITLDGAKSLKKIIINPECTSDLEGLQDLILAAFQDAEGKLQQSSENSPFPSMPWG